MDWSCPECCSGPDSSAKFPESKAPELFPASVKSEWVQELYPEPWVRSLLYPVWVPQCQAPAWRYQAASCPESGWILGCWFPGPQLSRSDHSWIPYQRPPCRFQRRFRFQRRCRSQPQFPRPSEATLPSLHPFGGSVTWAPLAKRELPGMKVKANRWCSDQQPWLRPSR